MKRRSVNKRNQQQPKVEVQQLPSKAEIKERESEYRKDLKDFEGGLIAGEKFKKNGIIKLAKDLEKAGTVEIHKIAIRLKADLKNIIDRGFLGPTYINHVLTDEDPKYVRPYNKQSKPTQKEDFAKSQNPEEQEQEDEEPANTTTTTYTTPLSTTTSRVEPTSKAPTEEEIEFQKYVSELYDFIRSLTQLLTGLEVDKFLTYRDNIKLAADTKRRRFDVSKRLPPLDLNTIYDDCIRFKVILDDFINHLGDERNSRRQKQEMISE
jgi:hypothetical protein